MEVIQEVPFGNRQPNKALFKTISNEKLRAAKTMRAKKGGILSNSVAETVPVAFGEKSEFLFGESYKQSNRTVSRDNLKINIRVPDASERPIFSEMTTN